MLADLYIQIITGLPKMRSEPNALNCFAMRGTLLNTATVVGGSLVGLAAGNAIPATYQTTVMTGLGLVVLGIGLKMVLSSKNIVVVVAAISLGGILGMLLGIQAGLEGFAEWARVHFQGTGRFNEAIITTSILFCVGPMTLLGCLQDGLEGKYELLAIKSALDGIGSVFFAAALGPGVLVTAAVLLVVQGCLTLLAKRLSWLARDEEMLSEVTASGGVMMMAISLSLLDIRPIQAAVYLPALALAPLLVAGSRKFAK
jgi:uncharacterized membrane protein YqgA involved in biofilm formation